MTVGAWYVALKSTSFSSWSAVKMHFANTSPLLVQSAGFYLGGGAILVDWKGQLLSEIHCFGRTNFLQQTVVLTMGKSHRWQGLKNVEVDNGDLSVEFTALRKLYFWHFTCITNSSLEMHPEWLGWLGTLLVLTHRLISHPDLRLALSLWLCLVIAGLSHHGCLQLAFSFAPPMFSVVLYANTSHTC